MPCADRTQVDVNIVLQSEDPIADDVKESARRFFLKLVQSWEAPSGSAQIDEDSIYVASKLHQTYTYNNQVTVLRLYVIIRVGSDERNSSVEPNGILAARSLANHLIELCGTANKLNELLEKEKEAAVKSRRADEKLAADKLQGIHARPHSFESDRLSLLQAVQIVPARRLKKSRG